MEVIETPINTLIPAVTRYVLRGLTEKEGDI